VPDTNRNVDTIREFPEARLWKAFAEASKSSSQHSVVLYVHGYNIDFVKGCRRASIFQTALDRQQRLLFFSWPSDGNLTSYTHDEADIEWSQSYLESVINRLTRIYGPGRVNIIAHSLGSRGVLRALQLISRSNGKGIINELVFLAPDIDTDVFRAVFPDIKKVARRITLYASVNDNPLRLSHEVHGYPRLGEAGENLLVMQGLDTIDVSISGGREVTGHLYHLYNDRVRADLGMLLRTNTAADKRPFLKKHVKDGLPFWLLMPVD
jgi:esterase/lipase superfamily enzyme